MRLDDDAFRWLRTLARAPLPALVPADADYFGKCMRTLEILPSRPDDEVRGELRFGIMRRHFGQYCREALSYLVQQATLRCRFMPSPVECKEILDEWQRADPAFQAQVLAKARVQIEAQARLDDAMAALAARSLDQAEVDALPRQFRMIAVERGYLHFAGGAFTVRHEAGSPLHTPAPRAPIKP